MKDKITKREFEEFDGYDQMLCFNSLGHIVEITCTCVYDTIQVSLYPKNPEKRRLCKHILFICKLRGLKYDLIR